VKSILASLAAVFIWSSMTTLRIQVISIPSFLVLGVAFLVSGSISLVYHKAWHIPLMTLLIGIGGIFGYHFLYFMAFTLAPAVEVNLINYLWPVLIVALTPLMLSGYKLHFQHLLGVGLGLLGVILIVTGGNLQPQISYYPGYLLALGAAFTWALYSLLTKRLPIFDSSAVSAFTFISGILSLMFYFVLGGSIAQFTQLTGREWLFVMLIGIGPLGGAFFLWDYALKHGDPRTIGSLAFLTPLLSTLLLTFFGGKNLTIFNVIALVLIIGGAVIGSIRLKVNDIIPMVNSDLINK
jgi:drug/metabolite transporter (DMT)-like permease